MAGWPEMTKKPLNIGMVGYGFMGRTHSNAFKQVPQFFDVGYTPVLKTVCARSADKAKAFAEQWGYESSVTDWRKLVDDKSIDLIDIASPNDTHMEIAIAAAEAGNDGARPFVALLEGDLEFVRRNRDALDHRNHTVHT